MYLSTENTISNSLNKILSALQTDGHSHRFNGIWRYRRADNSLFALSSTLYVLQSLKMYFSESDKILFQQIQETISQHYSAYKNKDGKASYNFYPTNPSRHFGHGYFMQYFDHFRLPDDIDDTALVYLTNAAQDKDISELLSLLKAHAHPSGVFNTWFGKNMPLEVDICANINMLLLFYKHDLGQSPLAQNVINLLIKSIDAIENKPFQLSRHYGHPVLIVYHYARFMAAYPDSPLDIHRKKLIGLTQILLKTKLSQGMRMLAETALMKWGVKIEKSLGNIDFADFYTFIGAPFAPLIGDKSFAFHPLALIYWQSDIYTEALKLEYTLLHQNQAN